jgi:molybdopterin-guanine dinucleotide biosynthesis protein MobB
VVGVVGWKDSGKTGLVERLVAHLAARGLRVATVKHAHHEAEVDRPGTDSHRHRAAGAAQVILATPARWALMTELRGAPEPDLPALLHRLDPCDLVLVEGFKHGPHPKIEAHRAATGRAPIARGDASVLAVASDGAPVVPCPVLPLDDTAALADLALRIAAPLEAPA